MENIIRSKSRKEYQAAPMPKVDDVIYPSEGGIIVSWDKQEKPQGKFVRILWDGIKHTAVCNPGCTTGIIAFIIGRAPGFGDILKIVGVGTHTCRAVAINEYERAVDKVMKNFENGFKEGSEEALEGYVYAILEDSDVMGMKYEDMTDEDLLKAQSLISWGVLMRLKFGPPPEYHDKQKE